MFENEAIEAEGSEEDDFDDDLIDNKNGEKRKEVLKECLIILF